MTSSTYLFAYSYWLFKKCFVKNWETLQLILSIELIQNQSNVQQVYDFVVYKALVKLK